MKFQTESQWHVTAGRTVIQSWVNSEGVEDLSQAKTKYGRFATTRPVDLADLKAYDERAAASRRFFDRLTSVLLIALIAGGLAMVTGLFVLPRLGTPSGVTLTVLVVSALVILAGMVTPMFVHRAMRRGLDEQTAAAGLASAEPKMLREKEARELIDQPGTRSSAVRRVG